MNEICALSRINKNSQFADKWTKTRHSEESLDDFTILQVKVEK